MTREEMLNDLERKIKISIDLNEKPNEADWYDETGIIISREQGEYIYSQLSLKEEEEKKPELFKYPDADCCEGILELYEGAYKCNSCGAFYGVDWEDGKTYLGNLEPLTPPTEKQ